jgi:hypothetical protein
MAMAQDAQQGSLTGFVYDQSQAVVPSASASVVNQATGLTRTASTTDAGVYTIVGLQPGTYNAKASAPGFKTVEQNGIVLDVGSSIRVNFSMSVGAVTETVVVTGVAPVLKTETGEISTLVSGTQIQELALNGRNFTQFLSLGTGVVSQQTGRQMGLGQEGNPLMAVHGGRISMNKYTYDGTLAMDTGGNRGLDLFPPMEAISEVKVQKSNYGADQGGFGHGIVNIVTRSGERQFHGDLYEYFRNDHLDSRNFFSNDRQNIRLNNFGYTFGGPFYIPGKYNTSRTKDFFFWSQSWARRVGPQITSYITPPTGVFTATVPTPAIRTGDFSGLAVIRDPSGAPYPNNRIPSSQIDSNALILINSFYTLPNRAGSPNYVYNTHSFTRYREELLRWDHMFNEKWMYTARYAQDTWSQDQDIMRPGNSPLPTFPNHSGKPGKNATTKLTTIVSPSKVNLFTFGYSYNEITNRPTGGLRPSALTIPQAFPSNTLGIIPDVTIAGYAALGITGALNNSNPIYTWKDDFSWNLGTHNLKAGVELMYHTKAQFNNTNEQGTFNFNGGVTGNGFADFLIGRAFTYTENDKDPSTEVGQWDNEFYVQDDIKVTSRLTVNAGLRYYLISGSNGGAAFNNRISAFVPGLYDPAKAPQLLADGQLVAGTGDPGNGLITGSDRRGLPIGPQLMKTNKDVFGPRFGFAYNLASKTVIRGGYGINSFWGTANNVGRHLNPPFGNSVDVVNTTLSNPVGGVGRRFPPSVNSLDIYNKQPTVQSWSFTIQRELAANMSLEIGYAGTRGTHLPRGIQLNQADPDIAGNANLRRPYKGYGTIPYNENTAVSKYHGLEVSLVRRFSRGLMLEGSYTFSKGLANAEGSPMDSRNKNLDFGYIDLDRTHVLSFNYVWELPIFKGRKDVLGRVIGGWQVSGISSFQSGLPLNITQPGDVASFGGGTGGQRPDIIGDPKQGIGESLNRYFNTAAFRAVTQTGRVGTSPFNPIHGPGIANFDVSLYKTVRFAGERAKLQFGVETFNTFNHPQFEAVGTQLNTATYGFVTDARDPRVVQLRGKISF